MQRDSYISTIDAPGTHESNEKIWKLQNELGWWRRDCNTNPKDHRERLDGVFTGLNQVDLKCKPSKCEILRDSIK